MFPFPPFPAGVPWTVLGLMAGTSADGADAALIRVAPAGFRNGKPFLDLIGHYHEPYPPRLRKSVLAAASDRMAPSELCVLQRQLGEHHARTAAVLCRDLELTQRLPGLRLEEDLHFPPGAREAVSWALLGAASAAGVAGSLPEVTGASRAGLLGSWVAG